MKELELLGTKAVKRVHEVPIAVSAGTSGSTNTLRVSFGSEVFNALFEPMQSAVGPRGVIIGAAESGLAVYLAKNQGNSLMSGKGSVAIRFSCRSLNATENKVTTQIIKALLIEFEDGQRVLATGPLPEAFMSTSLRNKLKNQPTQYSKLYENAYLKKFGVAPGQAEAEKKVSPLEPPKAVEVAPAPAPAPAPAQIAPVDAYVPPVARTAADLRELIKMVNDEVDTMRSKDPNADVILRIENGRLRAQLKVVYQEDI